MNIFIFREKKFTHVASSGTGLVSSKSQRISKSHYWFKSYSNIAELVYFAYWWRCIRRIWACSVRNRLVFMSSVSTKDGGWHTAYCWLQTTHCILKTSKCIFSTTDCTKRVAPELLKVEDVRTHICAIFLRICSTFVPLNVKPEKQALFYDFKPIPMRLMFSKKIWLRKRNNF